MTHLKLLTLLQPIFHHLYVTAVHFHSIGPKCFQNHRILAVRVLMIFIHLLHPLLPIMNIMTTLGIA